MTKEFYFSVREDTRVLTGKERDSLIEEGKLTSVHLNDDVSKYRPYENLLAKGSVQVEVTDNIDMDIVEDEFNRALRAGMIIYGMDILFDKDVQQKFFALTAPSFKLEDLKLSKVRQRYTVPSAKQETINGSGYDQTHYFVSAEKNLLAQRESEGE